MTTVQIEKKKRYTYEDYERLPEGSPYQLIGGELIMTPAPIPYHQKILGNIFFEMKKFVEKNNLGEVYPPPTDVYFSETDTYQPDILFISKNRLNIIGEKKIEGPPDLIIEILSPETAYYDLRVKKDTYEKSGVKEYWIVDPIKKSIEIYENREKKFELIASIEGKGKIESRLIKGFSVEIEVLFL